MIAERTGSVPDAVTALEQHGETVIALGEGRRALAWFGLADEPRLEAADAVTALRVAGITRIVMLTGDAEPVARAVAEGTGIAEWRAGLLPEDKLRAVGVAMGAAGSDVALQSADVAQMGDRLDRLAVAVGLSRRALRIMRFNVIASLVVKGRLHPARAVRARHPRRRGRRRNGHVTARHPQRAAAAPYPRDVRSGAGARAGCVRLLPERDRDTMLSAGTASSSTSSTWFSRSGSGR